MSKVNVINSLKTGSACNFPQKYSSHIHKQNTLNPKHKGTDMLITELTHLETEAEFNKTIEEEFSMPSTLVLNKVIEVSDLSENAQDDFSQFIKNRQKKQIAARETLQNVNLKPIEVPFTFSTNLNRQYAEQYKAIAKVFKEYAQFD